MKKPGFYEGVLVALIASVTGAATFAVLTMLLDTFGVLRLVIGGVSFAYVGYLLLRSHDRVGRVTVMGFWVLATLLSWLFVADLLVYALIQLGMIWLVRSLYFYSSVLSALADLGLVGLGFITAIWAATETNSVFMGLWSFFLVQALFITIPVSIQRNTVKPDNPLAEDERFERAHQIAEAAVRKLSSVN